MRRGLTGRYLHDFSQDSHPGDPTILPTHDALGHGTINASIMGGFNNKSGNAFADAQGFEYGLGIARSRESCSKLFPDSRSSSTFSYTQFISEAYRAGARCRTIAGADALRISAITTATIRRCSTRWCVTRISTLQEIRVCRSCSRPGTTVISTGRRYRYRERRRT